MAAVYMDSGAFIVGKKEEDSLLSQRPFFFPFHFLHTPNCLVVDVVDGKVGVAVSM